MRDVRFPPAVLQDLIGWFPSYFGMVRLNTAVRGAHSTGEE